MSINKDLSSSGLINIQQLLDGQDFYKIPLMQRNYVWNKENLEEFITDIKDSMEEDINQQYFIEFMCILFEL